MQLDDQLLVISSVELAGSLSLECSLASYSRYLGFSLIKKGLILVEWDNYDRADWQIHERGRHSIPTSQRSSALIT